MLQLHFPKVILLDQNYSFNKCNNLTDYDFTRIEYISKNFNQNIIENFIKIKLKNSLINREQFLQTQIIYFDKYGVRINPSV